MRPAVAEVRPPKPGKWTSGLSRTKKSVSAKSDAEEPNIDKTNSRSECILIDVATHITYGFALWST